MIFLVDNGSVRPEAYLNLCALADLVSQSIGEPVVAAPLLHANRIPPMALHGRSAKILEELIKEAYDQGDKDFKILPLFFGPSNALTDYLPRRLKNVSQLRPGFQVQILNSLFVSEENGGDILVDILEAEIRQTIEKNTLESSQVILVDHGSPKKEVIDVRNNLAGQLARRLRDSNLFVTPASMERRSGAEYDFCNPLLESLLDQEPFSVGSVIVALLFLSPGRHAGHQGDIAQICKRAESRHTGLTIHSTALVGSNPLIIELLHRRWKERIHVGRNQY